MFRIENIGENLLYVKVLGTLPPSVAEKFVQEFNEKIKELKKFSVIVDGLDFILLNLTSLDIILELLKKNNEKLVKSAYVISKNPLLDAEAQYLIEKADSPNRKIVKTLDEAKEWIGISDIIIKYD